MNVKSHSFVENRSFQLKPDLLFDEIVNLADEGNRQKLFFVLFKVYCCFYRCGRHFC